MSLRVYNRKRKFSETPEPRGKKAASASGHLRFVVQMHAATRLHFDFRLEFDGVFKSWAVPKGPSLNPLDQRLAVFVEDHPLDYGSFEGIIPKGNYGAGTVMVWDEGTYVERGSAGRQDSAAAMRKNFDKGHITFVLSGRKLNGEFALVRLKKDASEKAWLLVKKRDAHSTVKRSETPTNESVKTGRTIEEIAAQAQAKGDVWLPKKGKPAKRQAPASAVPVEPRPPRPSAQRRGASTVAIPSATKRRETSALRKRGDAIDVPARARKKSPVPRKVKPMIATLSRQRPDPGWIIEPQLDGLRAIAEVEGKRVSLYSKAGISYNARYPQIVEELKRLNTTAVFDGEIAGAAYCVFDLLYRDDRDLRQEPLRIRKGLLRTALRQSRHLKLIDACRAEAKIAKNPESLYKSGTTSEWRLLDQSSGTADADGPRLTNLDKVFFPADGITKGDLIDYYSSIAPFLLPYLHDRPESLNRLPNGIAKPGFYQKDLTGHIPRWLKTERIFSESADKSIDYLVCQDKRSLLYMVNLGCVEIHPWFSRLGHSDQPDFLVIDLDPDGNSFDHVMEIAREIHALLNAVGAVNFCKTSGATGIHIGVPLGAKYDFEAARAFAEDLCTIVAQRYPATTSIDRNPSRRQKKIYLDFMQNRRGQTLAAPFCVRPHKGAPVSMPLSWKELKPGLRPGDFNIGNAISRIKKFDGKTGDPWRGVLGPAIDLPKCARALRRKHGKD